MNKKTMTVDKSTLTRRQIEVLEAVFHTGDPWRKKAGGDILHFMPIGTQGHAGGAVSRMIEELRKRHYITVDSIPSALTQKGLEVLASDKIAMKAIDERELAGRITKRRQIESEDTATAERVRHDREKHRMKREAESKATRVKKLREVFDDAATRSLFQFDQKDGPKLVASDDDLLALAGRIADIELIY